MMPVMPRCQRCGQYLRDGQAICVGCGSPTGMRMAVKKSGVGCIALIVGFLLVIVLIAGTAIGIFVSAR